MRIHTDILTVTDIYRAAARAGGGDYQTSPVLVTVSEHGSRSRRRAFNVNLTGTSSRPARNTSNKAATWDEWGMFLGELFRRDSAAAVPNVYESGEHFRWVTGSRFDNLTPLYQHGGAGHRWGMSHPNITGVYRVRACKNCEAIHRYMAPGFTFAEIAG